MITRIVKLEFKEECVEDFKSIFEQSKPHILNFDGCNHVACLQDIKSKHVFFTYSHWRSEDDLNQYRKSKFFGQVWPKTKSMLSRKPEAWSTTIISE